MSTEETPPRIWIFGCFKERGASGHALFDAKGSYAETDVPLEVSRACDHITSIARDEQVEGRLLPVRQMPEGFSFVSWWDRQGDRRTGSHTGVLARGLWTPAQLIAAARTLAPWAFRVEVKS